MRFFLLIIGTFILQPFPAKAQVSKQYESRNHWLVKRYQDSIGLSKDMADSIVSFESASMKVYHKMLSDYNRAKAEEQKEIPFPDLKKPFADGTSKIKMILTPDQFNIWRRLQIGKYRDYSKPGINIHYLSDYPIPLRNKIMAHVHVSPAVTDSLLLFAQEYNRRLAIIYQTYFDAGATGSDINKSINHLNAQARRVLNNNQFLEWINWQGNKN